MTAKEYHIYIMASPSGTLYLGITNNIQRRVYEHKQSLISGFSQKYDCKKLVYFESFNNVEEAIAREKQLKGWNRKKKEKLILSINPHWNDLSTRF